MTLSHRSKRGLWRLPLALILAIGLVPATGGPAARAEEGWPHLPTDGEIARARERLVAEKWEQGRGTVYGTLTISYDHHQRGLAARAGQQILSQQPGVVVPAQHAKQEDLESGTTAKTACSAACRSYHVRAFNLADM